LLDLLILGLGDREIADRLMISYETARSRGKALRRKLGASSRAQVVAKALQLGLARLGKR
jgi:DNA-binding CsgD family transcriptional regulator